jgi:hypothetical protein
MRIPFATLRASQNTRALEGRSHSLAPHPPASHASSFLQARKKLLSTLVPEECTFQPRTNVRRPASAAASPSTNASAAAAAGAGSSSEPEAAAAGSSAAAAAAAAAASPSSTGDRLYAQAAARSRRLEARQAQVVASLTFNPTILPRSAALVAKDKAAHVDRTADLYQRVSLSGDVEPLVSRVCSVLVGSLMPVPHSPPPHREHSLTSPPPTPPLRAGARDSRQQAQGQ